MSQAIDRLDRELRELKISSEADYLRWVAMAARLAALGGRDETPRWSEVAGDAAADPGASLQEHARRGARRILQSHGPELALAVVDAQDFAFFLHARRQDLPAEVSAALDVWVELADHNILDDHSAAELEAFRADFALPEERLLLPMAVPVSLEELQRAGGQAVRPTWTVHWSQAQASKQPEVEWALAADGTPGIELQRSYERAPEEFELPDGRVLRALRQLRSDWTVSVGLQAVRPTPLNHPGEQLARARLGSLPLHLQPQSERWEVELASYPREFALHILKERLSMVFADGRQVHIE